MVRPLEKLPRLPLEVVRARGKRRRHHRVTHTTRGSTTVRPTMLFAEFVRTTTTRTCVTDGATSNRYGYGLVLLRLVFILRLFTRDLRVGATMTPRAVNAAVPTRVAIQRIPRVNLSDALVTRHALGFINPGDPFAFGDGLADIRKTSMTGRTIPVARRVCFASAALRRRPRVAVVASDPFGFFGVLGMNNLRKVPAVARARLPECRTTVTIRAKNWSL